MNGEKVVDQEKQGTAAAAAPNSPQLPGSPVPIESGDASAGAYAANANDPEERAKRLAAIEQRKQKVCIEIANSYSRPVVILICPSSSTGPICQ